MSPIDTHHLRNVALVSHSGAGKTSLAEAMLLACGEISRLGKIEDGNTTTNRCLSTSCQKSWSSPKSKLVYRDVGPLGSEYYLEGI
jgi:ABC-type transport system involved in cytochrome bd biosynthesis fused ATPase/permease subunit